MRKVLLVLFSLMLLLPAELIGQDDTPVGQWVYQDHSDPVTEVNTDFGFYFDEDEEAGVGVKCFTDGEANVLFAVMDLSSRLAMVGEDYAYLSYRIGDRLQSNEHTWSYSQNKDIALAGNRESDRIVAAIRAADRDATLAFRIYSYEGEPQQTVETPVAGAKRVLGSLSCLAGTGT